MPIDLTPTPLVISSVYGSYAALAAEMGSDNVNLVSDPNVSGDINQITANQQQAANYADNYINSQLSNNGFLTPVQNNLDQLAVIWAKLAAFQLYQLRGIDNEKDNYFTEKRDYAMTQLRELTFGNRGGFILNGTNYTPAMLTRNYSY